MFEGIPLILALLFGVLIFMALVSDDKQFARRWKAMLQSFEDEEKEKNRLAVMRYPTYADVMAALRYEDYCGCRYDWAASPPCGWTCQKHIFIGLDSAVPDSVEIAWRARRVLQAQGRFHA